MRRVRNHAFLWSALFLLLWTISLPKPGNVLNESVANNNSRFLPGDVGKSLVTAKGTMWIYGDSWHPGGVFIRNAITLNGRYQGTIRGGAKGNWIWLASAYNLPDGKVAGFGSEMGPKDGRGGMWDFRRVGQVYVQFDPDDPSKAKVTRIDKTSTPWSSASAEDRLGPLVYTIDSKHRPRVGRPGSDGSVKPIATLDAKLSGQFSVLQDDNGRWWMVGLGMMLSRKLWAYPMASPTGPVNGKKVLLMTLPSPGGGRYAYHANIHPEENGLLTWAVSGRLREGLQRIEGFWPSALGDAQDLRTDPTTDEDSDNEQDSGLADEYGPGA